MTPRELAGLDRFNTQYGPFPFWCMLGNGFHHVRGFLYFLHLTHKHQFGSVQMRRQLPVWPFCDCGGDIGFLFWINSTYFGHPELGRVDPNISKEDRLISGLERLSSSENDHELG